MGVPGGPAITDREFQAFRELIHRLAGIRLSDAKRALVCARLQRRLRQLGLSRLSDYYRVVEADPTGAERQELINCITTNKTDFFRESHHFDLLRRGVIAEARTRVRAGGPRRLRVWSAGCSTGEEPYTIAMAIREELRGAIGWDVRILASDIDTSVLEIAREGIYPEERLAGVPEELRRRHFLRGRGRYRGLYRVRPELQAMIAFRRINLNEEPWPIRARFDAIFCRNVIIYFDRPTQQRLFARLAERLVPGGWLMVGHSESLHWLSDLFTPVGASAYRLGGGGGASRGAGGSPAGGGRCP